MQCLKFVLGSSKNFLDFQKPILYNTYIGWENTMAGYTRDFLVSAFADKYAITFDTEDDFFEFKIKMGYDFFDKVGKTAFRVYTALDAAAIKQYKESIQ